MTLGKQRSQWKRNRENCKGLDEKPQCNMAWTAIGQDPFHPDHIMYAIRNRYHDAEVLKEKIDNFVCRYMNIHENFYFESSCRVDVNFEPSKLILTAPVTKKVFLDALHQTAVYKSSEDNIHALDNSMWSRSTTYWTFFTTNESFSGLFLQYEDSTCHLPLEGKRGQARFGNLPIYICSCQFLGSLNRRWS